MVKAKLADGGAGRQEGYLAEVRGKAYPHKVRKLLRHYYPLNHNKIEKKAILGECFRMKSRKIRKS